MDITEDIAGIAAQNVRSTERMEAAVKRHGAAIKETVAASAKLSELASELMSVVESFKLD